MDKKTEPNSIVSGFPSPATSCPGHGVSTEVFAESHLLIDHNLLMRTLDLLRIRSNNQRESAAIWAGRIIEDRYWHAEELYLHHELCEDRSGPLSVQLTELAKFKLYETLARKRRCLIALIHTHPRANVALSEVDQVNQLSSRVGFWSIVIPWYSRPPWHLNDMGFHIRASEGWVFLKRNEIKQRVRIGGNCGKL